MRDGNMGILLNEKLLWNTMVQGNPGALTVVKMMLTDSDPNSMFDLVYLEGLEIKGPKLWQLYSDCSNKNFDKMKKTISLFKLGVFSENDIHSNIGLDYAISFIDDNIDYGEDFGPGDEKWEEYCLEQKESFDKRLKEHIKKYGYDKTRRKKIAWF